MKTIHSSASALTLETVCLLKLFIVVPNGKSSCPPKAVESQLMGPFPSQAKTTIISRQAFVYLDLFRPRLCGQVPKITGWHLPFIYKIITTLQSTISGANNYFLKLFLLSIYSISISCCFPCAIG